MQKITLICHVEPTFRSMVIGFVEFVDTYRYEIKEFQKSSAGARCVMKDGIVHEFIPEESYRMWCVGKTYMLPGSMQVFHSGYPCRLDLED